MSINSDTILRIRVDVRWQPRFLLTSSYYNILLLIFIDDLCHLTFGENQFALKDATEDPAYSETLSMVGSNRRLGLARY